MKVFKLLAKDCLYLGSCNLNEFEKKYYYSKLNLLNIGEFIKVQIAGYPTIIERSK